MTPQAKIIRKEHAKFSTDAIINHNPTEFRFTFFDTFLVNKQHNQTIMNKDIVGEIVLTPMHSKAFLKALADNVKKYEEQHGEIKLPNEPTTSEASYR